MGRRFATIASVITAGADMFGRLGRRYATLPSPLEESSDQESSVEDTSDSPAKRVPLGIEHAVSVPATETRMPTHAFGAPCLALPPVDADMEASLVRSTLKRTPVAAEPHKSLADMINEIVAPYPLDAGKRLELQVGIRDVANAIGEGTLVEGAVIVDFDWMPSPGVFMTMAISVLVTEKYLRINFCDASGVLRAPELDVYIRGQEVRVVPDHTTRMIDIEERRSDAVVTRAKLKALAEGIGVHPGNVAAVLARCRITGTPFGPGT